MRIRVIQTVILAKVDGIRLDVMLPGALYEMGSKLGAMFLAEGWGEPIASDEPGLPGAASDGAADSVRT